MYSWELLKRYFTLSSTRQSSFLWRFLRTWRHTPQAFLEHHGRTGHIYLREGQPQHRELHAVLFSNCVGVLQRPTWAN